MTASPHTRRPALARLTTALGGPARLLRAPVEVDSPGVLRTPRFLLRPLLASDRYRFCTLLRDSREHLARHFPLYRESESDDEVFERQLAYSNAALASGKAWRRVIALGDGRIAGCMNLNDIEPSPEPRAEFNLWLGPSFTGRGIAIETLNAALAHAFALRPRGLGLAAVYGCIAPDNAASLGMIGRAGFVPAPRARPIDLNLAGRWVTHHLYVLRAPTTTFRRPATIDRLVSSTVV